jgi:hypothetical protein
MARDRTYLHQSQEYTIFLHNTRLYFETIITEGRSNRTVLISMNINDVSLEHHSSTKDTLPIPVHNKMLDICAGLRATRKQLIYNDLRERKVQLARIHNSYVEYVVRVIDSEKGDCVHYDCYTVLLEGTVWKLGAPHYWGQYLKTKRQRGVFKAYFTPKGESYFNVDKKRINLSDFTKLF